MTNIDLAKLCTPTEAGIFYIRSSGINQKGVAAMIPILAGEKAEGGKWPFDPLTVIPLPVIIAGNTDDKVTIETIAPFTEKKLAPLLARGATHVILDGVTRYTAAVAAKWERIPIKSDDSPDLVKAIIGNQLAENFSHGTPLTPGEKAAGVKEAKKAGFDNKSLAKLLGLHESSVSRMARALQGMTRDAYRASRKPGGKKKAEKARKTGKDEKAKKDTFEPGAWLSDLWGHVAVYTKEKKVVLPWLQLHTTAPIRNQLKTLTAVVVALSEAAAVMSLNGRADDNAAPRE